jgi:hypothetical protein
MGDALADRLDHAGDFAARREGAVGLELVLVLDDQDVGVVHAAGLDRQHHLAGAGLRARKLLEDQGLGSAHALAQHRLHAVSPMLFH